ncbi:Serine dehydratase alpha chain [Carpediemonas membranifera]|uniref:Serine dehydratase alpha chain n=1 Tax=Carpediemonas membranifera TaxID=201153 RepID=A0A8J6B1W2_9EUKA|nr:Serine dehydratase alpha chain [Carpediemonas membranifera]|eukprot:KAG9391232.1 Serine dehydratase alpha chain [Carpediemonas membranifera]
MQNKDIEDIGSRVTTFRAPIPRSMMHAPNLAEIKPSVEEALEIRYPPPKALQSLKELYKVGYGPSSSHTLGPRAAAEDIKRRFMTQAGQDYSVTATLYGSLAATGKGHFTDQAIIEVFAPCPVKICWNTTDKEITKPHPNAVKFQVQKRTLTGILMDVGEDVVYSVGGGSIVWAKDMNKPRSSEKGVYECKNMKELIEMCEDEGLEPWQIVARAEHDPELSFLQDIWTAMSKSIESGFKSTGVLPGPLRLARKANATFRKARRTHPAFQRTPLLAAYALAVSEENAGMSCPIVTAPTCGSCGLVPAVLRYLKEVLDAKDDEIVKALAVAGLVGNIVKANASISGAEVGCQGEVGVAAAMAAAAAADLMGGTIQQIEYAAEIAIEQHLGLTCDPVQGYVQIPCIERNALSATRAVDCAEYALASDGRHLVSFDEAILVMKLTGLAMDSKFRETAEGGLAAVFGLDKTTKNQEQTMKHEREQKRRLLEAALKNNWENEVDPDAHDGDESDDGGHPMPLPAEYQGIHWADWE